MIGASIWSSLERKCQHCDTFDCEDSKSNMRSGTLLEFTNPSTKCPRAMFGERMRADAKLRAYVARIRATETPDTATSTVLVCPASETFQREKHMFSMKTIRQHSKVEGLASTPLVGVDQQVHYNVIGNRLVSRGAAMTCMEYADPRIPGALVLLPVV